MILVAALLLGALPVFGTSIRNALESLPRQDVWVPNGPVNAMVESNGVLYVGGEFSHLEPNRGTGVGLDLSALVLLPAFPAANGTVRAVVSDGSGGFYLGGDFTEVGGETAVHLAYVRPDGSVDPSWHPRPDGVVTALALAGRTLYAAGAFDRVEGLARDGLAALDAATGEVLPWTSQLESNAVCTALAVYRGRLVAAWISPVLGGPSPYRLTMLDPVTGAPTSWAPTLQGGPILSLAIAGDTLFVGGRFTQMNGAARNGLAALDAITGALLPWNPMPQQVPGNALPVVIQSLDARNGRVYLGGRFGVLGGQIRNGLGAVNSLTGAVLSWNPAATNPGPPDIQSVAASENAVFVAGAFTRIGGANRNGFAALSPLDGVALVPDSNVLGPVVAIAISHRTVYLAGGRSGNNAVARSNLAAIDLETGKPTSWNPGVDGPVHALALAHGKLYLGGQFTTVQGRMRNNIAALDPVTGAAHPDGPQNASGVVYALAPGGDVLYVGGAFTGMDDRPRSNLAALNADGSVSGWAPAADRAVRALMFIGSTVYAGGEFTTINGMGREGLAAIHSSNELTPWNPRANGPVFALSRATDPKFLYAGGDFTTVAGQARLRLAQIDVDTGTPASWDPGADGAVRALALRSGNVFVGGDFRNVGGRPRNRLAEVLGTLGAVTEWNPDPDGPVYALLALQRALAPALAAGGSFSKLGGRIQPGLSTHTLVGAPRIVRQPANVMEHPGRSLVLSVDAIGTLPLSFVWKFNGVDLPATGNEVAIEELTLAHEGLYVATVSNALGRVESYPALVTVLDPPVMVLQPASQTVSPGGRVTLFSSARGNPRPRYQWRKNGVPIPGAIESSLGFEAIAYADAGVYSVQAFNPAGVATSADAAVVVTAPAFPFSDNVDESIKLTEPRFVVSGDNARATREPGEPEHAGLPGGKSVWLTWRVPSGGVGRISSAGSGFDTLLAVYTRSPAGELVEVVADDDSAGFGWGTVLFNVEAARDYLVAVDGYLGASGAILLELELATRADPIPVVVRRPQGWITPPGSDVTFSIEVLGPNPILYQWYHGENRIEGATGPSLTIANAQVEHLGRYTVHYTDSRTGVTQISPAALHFGPLVIPVDFDKPTIPYSGSVSFGGNATLSLGFHLGNLTAPSPNLTPCNSVLYNGVEVTNLVATQPGTFILDTAGTPFKTVVSVFTGIPPLHTVIACAAANAPNGFDTRLKFNVAANVKHTIYVAGLNGASGPVTLNITFCTAPILNASPTPTFEPVTAISGGTQFAVELANPLCDPGFQWLKNGVPIPGATAAILAYANPVQPGDVFSVTVMNCAGATSVTIAAFVEFWIERGVLSSQETFTLRTQPGVPFPVHVEVAQDDFQWGSFHAHPGGTPLQLPVNSPRVSPAHKFFRLRPPLYLPPP